ncbi:MFS transporter [Rhodococcus rhodochrous]|uniref:MFS transporter n=1 Tax=Rhodococcus rhodochrous TaxID=1829 RepID=UPI00036EF3F5|nr:MFS transporter [Rhodococcus rhodochrous]
MTVDPVFGPFFWGKLLSSCGTWTFVVVAAILAFDLSGSAWAVGMVTVAHSAPQLLCAPFSGQLADRGKAATQIVVGSLLTGVGAGGLALWLWLVGGADGLPGLTPVMLSSVVVGLGFAIGGPAMQSIVPTMIRPGEMAAAMSLNTVPITVGRAGGPAMGAAVAAQWGLAPAFMITAVTHIVFGIILWTLRIPSGPAPRRDTDFSMRSVLRYLRAHRALLVLLLGIAAVGVGVDPAVTLAPALAEHLGAGTALAGWMASCFGIGAGIGFLLFGPLHRCTGIERLGSGGLLLIAGGLVCAGVVGDAVFALIAFGVSGVGMTLAFTSITTQIQNRSPDEFRGRIMALWFVGFVGARPFVAGLSGWVTDTIGVTAALVAVALSVVAVAYLCRPGYLASPRSITTES